MARAQNIRHTNIVDHRRSRRSRQMTSDVLKTLMVLTMIIVGYFAFAPDASVNESAISIAAQN